MIIDVEFIKDLIDRVCQARARIEIIATPENVQINVEPFVVTSSRSVTEYTVTPEDPAAADAAPAGTDAGADDGVKG